MCVGQPCEKCLEGGETMDRRDVLLAVLAAAGDKALQPAHLQKSLFLIGKSGAEGLPKAWYDFQPYHYGPFDKAVYENADHCAHEGLVIKLPQVGQRWWRYTVTPEGRERGLLVLSQLPQTTQEYIRALVAWVTSLSFPELIRTIYTLFPEYKANSVFVDQQ